MDCLLNISTLESVQMELTEKQVLIIKFTADWCGPCKGIKPICEKYTSNLSENILFQEIDVDESIELYSFLKTKKMVNGIPAILGYYGGNKDIFYIPDDAVLGGDKKNVEAFFERIISKYC